MNFREQIVGLLRGRYAVPALSSLAELGLAERLLEGRLALADLPHAMNRNRLAAILDYLASIGILARNDDGYEATELGRHILPRSGSACIMESYNDYFTNLTAILSGAIAQDSKFKTDRALNILGSGSLHRRKYFLPGLDLAQAEAFEALIDLGCGDGSFLRAALERGENVKKITALDLSGTAVETAKQKLQEIFARDAIEGIVCDAGAVDVWARMLSPPPQGCELISAWFVIHEFCRGDAHAVIRFFQTIAAHRPHAHILFGEIVKIDPATLAQSRSQTIMPEYLLFHALSGQAPLSWADWAQVRKAIPYRVVGELLCDPIPGGGTEVPASFVWYLAPNPDKPGLMLI